MEATNRCSLFYIKGSGAMLRVVYAYSVMVMKCCTAATGATGPVTSEALTQAKF